MTKGTKYPPELGERAICMVCEQCEHHASQWTANETVAQKTGCAGQSLKNWIAKREGKAGADDAASAPRVRGLEREVRELKQTNEILKLVSALFRPGGARPPFKVK